MKDLLRKRFSLLLACVVLFMGLAACGGGGGGSDGQPPQVEESRWDTMVWDQGDWQ
jgi:hypothetical protein